MGSWPLVREGNSDSEESNGVIKVQRLLRHHGFDVAPDHVFGPATAGAVRAFQAARGLDDDGIVGDQMWPQLIVQLQQGDAGEAVLALQSSWRFIDHDGIYGPTTHALVTDFQEKSQIAVDGIAGPQTWRSLGIGPIIDAPLHLRHDTG